MAGVVLVSGMVGGPRGRAAPAAPASCFGVGTSAAYAAFLLILRRHGGRSPHVAGPLADATAGAAVGSLLVGLVFGGLQLDIRWPSFGWLLLLALTSQTIGWLLITSSLPRLPAAISSLLLLLQPAAAMVLAAAILGERPSLTQLTGAAVVCCGVLAVARAAHWRRSPLLVVARPGRWPAGRSRRPAPSTAGQEHQPQVIGRRQVEAAAVGQQHVLLLQEVDHHLLVVADLVDLRVEPREQVQRAGLADASDAGDRGHPLPGVVALVAQPAAGLRAGE